MCGIEKLLKMGVTEGEENGKTSPCAAVPPSDPTAVLPAAPAAVLPAALAVVPLPPLSCRPLDLGLQTGRGGYKRLRENAWRRAEMR
jgi:hypothetical protein